MNTNLKDKGYFNFEGRESIVQIDDKGLFKGHITNQKRTCV